MNHAFVGEHVDAAECKRTEKGRLMGAGSQVWHANAFLKMTGNEVYVPEFDENDHHQRARTVRCEVSCTTVSSNLLTSQIRSSC